MVHVSVFLSPAWLDELRQAAATSDRLQAAARGIHLTIQHRVTGGPTGDVGYRVCFADGSVTVENGDGDGDVVVIQAYETAAAISRGDLTPAQAFARGQVRLGGRPGLLARHREALSSLDDVFADLRERTRY